MLVMLLMTKAVAKALPRINRSCLLVVALLSEPEAHILLEVTMSKEPLGPVTINDDSAWFDTVKWVTYGLIQAEEFGLTADTIEASYQQRRSQHSAFCRRRRDTGNSDMGLPNDFMLRAIKHVGNYGEIFERNLGKESQFELDRGQNALWTEGGLMYAPPFR